jgi:hypothetical protein
MSLAELTAFRRVLWGAALMSLVLGGPLFAKTISVIPGDTSEVNIAKIEGAFPGDEVVVLPGTYQFRILLEKQGTTGQPIIIRASDPNHRPVWDLQGKPVADWPGSSRREDSGRSIWQITGSNYQISGIEFRNGTDGGTGDSGGVRFVSSGPVTLRNCVFRFNDNGIQGAGSDVLVESCEFDRNGLPDSREASHNLYIHGGVITVRYCFIHDARRAQNFHIRAKTAVLEYNWIAQPASYMGDMMPCTMEPSAKEQTILLRGNVFIQGTPANDGQIFVMYNDQRAAGITFRLSMVNNTFIGSGDPAALIHFANDNPTNNVLQAVVLNNNVFFHVSRIMRVDRPSLSNWQFSGTHNWISSGTLDQGDLKATVSGADPVFASASSHDYRPAASSPLVGAAEQQLADLPTKEYYRDEAITMQGRDRVSAKDIGAFEHTTAVAP